MSDWRSDLKSSLERAANLASANFLEVERLQKKAKSSFEKLDERLAISEDNILKMRGAPELKKELLRVCHGRRQEIREQWDDWVERFQLRRKDLSKFTIMLFGRTMTGKSTTFEALTCGDGSSIGNGAPDFTKDIHGREWNGLHVVDTPGLEGFKPELQKMAEEYIDRADAVFFLVSDDHHEPEIIEKMARIYAQNKPIRILLNIKGRIDRLLVNQNLIFRADEIDGHVRRIRGYLKEHFGFDSIPILPFCADAAFAAIQERKHENAEALLLASRFGEIQDEIVGLVCESGVSIRARVAYESLMHHFENIEDDLRIRVAAIKRQLPVLVATQKRSASSFYDMHHHFGAKLSSIKDHFVSLNDEVETLVESIVAGDCNDPSSRFRKILRLDVVEKSLSKMRTEIVADIETEMVRIAHDLQVDLKCSLQDSLKCEEFRGQIDLGTFARVKRKTGKALKIAGAPAVGFLVGVGVYNFWNPVGWAAIAAATVVSAGAAAVAAFGVKKGGEAIEDSGEQDLRALKRDARKVLKDNLWKNYRSINERNYKWLCKIINSARNDVESSLKHSHLEGSAFVKSAEMFLDQTKQIRSDASVMALKAVFPFVYGADVVNGLEILAAPRRLGYRMKVLFRSTSPKAMGGILVGANGENVRRLQFHSGSEQIDFVEHDVKSGEVSARMICAALRPAVVSSGAVSFLDDSPKSAEVVISQGENAGKLFGHHWWNLRLAEDALGLSIRIKTI